jgi:hypothetical protein
VWGCWWVPGGLKFRLLTSLIAQLVVSVSEVCRIPYAGGQGLWVMVMGYYVLCGGGDGGGCGWVGGWGGGGGAAAAAAAAAISYTARAALLA